MQQFAYEIHQCLSLLLPCVREVNLLASRHDLHSVRGIEKHVFNLFSKVVGVSWRKEIERILVEIILYAGPPSC